VINRNQVSPLPSISKLFLLLPRWIESFVTGRSESVVLAEPVLSITPAEMTLPARERGKAVYWLDSFIEFIALERALILRTAKMQSQGNLIRAFTDSFSVYVVIMAHVWLYWATDRSMPAGISYLDFNISAFTIWPIFSRMSHAIRPSMLAANVQLRIRWINTLIADCTWIVAKALVGMGAVYGTFVLFPAPYLTGINSTPNVMFLLALTLLAALFGAGFGMVVQVAKTFWPLIEAVMEVVTWLMFVTSGIYEAYSMLPPQIAMIYSFNPMMTVVEWSRYSLDPGYPVNGLDLSYPILVTIGLITLGLAMRRRAVRVETP
jgi:ABC-type polysaccharide/polyol phosphate export permease